MTWVLNRNAWWWCVLIFVLLIFSLIALATTSCVNLNKKRNIWEKPSYRPFLCCSLQILSKDYVLHFEDSLVALLFSSQIKIAELNYLPIKHLQVTQNYSI